MFGKKPPKVQVPPAPAPPTVTKPDPPVENPKPQTPTPAQPPPRPVRPKPAPPVSPAPVPPTAQPQTPAPSFGEILTPEQRTQRLKAYESSAQMARQSLAQIQGRALSRDQLDTANRVRSFLKEAEDAKGRDPSAAAQLAQRAELLAASLAASLR